MSIFIVVLIGALFGVKRSLSIADRIGRSFDLWFDRAMDVADGKVKQWHRAARKKARGRTTGPSRKP